MCGNNFDPGTHLDFEKMWRPLDNQERTIIQRRQRRLDAIMADQNIPSQQQILWERSGCRCSVVVCLKRGAASQNALEVPDERRRRRLWSGKELPWQNQL